MSVSNALAQIALKLLRQGDSETAHQTMEVSLRTLIKAYEARLR